VYRALLNVYMLLLIVHRALLSGYRALLRVDKNFFCVYGARFECIWGSFEGSFECVQGFVECSI